MQDYRPPADLLKDRLVLITGAGGGIGGALALACAAHGARTVLLGRTVKKLEAVYDAIERIAPDSAAILPCDLARGGLDQYEALAEAVAKEYGRIDGLVHAATILGVLSPLELYPTEQWDRSLRVNLYAPYLLTRACVPLLKKSRDASVVFTTADVGRRGRAYWGAYGIAQFALEGMAQIWADELEGNTAVRVNTIDPGKVATDFHAQAYPAVDKTTLAAPAQVVNTYLYLLGADSAGITGRAFNAQ